MSAVSIPGPPTAVTTTAADAGSSLTRRAEALSRLAKRWPAARPSSLVAVASVVAGGLVAAVSRPTTFEPGPWVAAYLVLVGGVAQLVVGAGAAWLAARSPSAGSVWGRLAVWNLGVLATIGGTLAAAPALTTGGGLALVVAVCWYAVPPRSAPGHGPRWVPFVWWATVLVLVASVPVGVALAWVRH